MWETAHPHNGRPVHVSKDAEIKEKLKFINAFICSVITSSLPPTGFNCQPRSIVFLSENCSRITISLYIYLFLLHLRRFLDQAKKVLVVSDMDSERAISVESCEKKKPFCNHVLVVDGNDTCLADTTKKLHACGYEATVVGRATDALSIISEREDEFDLVLTEIHLPDMDGLEFLEKLERLCKLVVIVLSADGDKKLMVKCLYKGAESYYEKPIPMGLVKTLWQFAYRKKTHLWGNTEAVYNFRIGLPRVHDEDQSYKRPRRMEQQRIEGDKNQATIMMKPKLVSTDTLVQEKERTIFEEKGKEDDHLFDVTESSSQLSKKEDFGAPSF